MFKDFQGPIGLDSEGLFLHIGLIKEVYCSTNKDFFSFYTQFHMLSLCIIMMSLNLGQEKKEK